MTAMQKTPLPWWLVVIIVLETLPMFLGPYAAVTRPAFLGGAEAEAINQAAFIYSIRNIAVGLAFILATALRSVSACAPVAAHVTTAVASTVVSGGAPCMPRSRPIVPVPSVAWSLNGKD